MTRLQHFFALAALGVGSAVGAFAQDAAAPIRRPSPSPAGETAPPPPTATPAPTAAPTAQEPAADRPTPAPQQSPSNVPTAKPVPQEEQAPATQAAPARRVIREKPVRAMESRPASERRGAVDDEQAPARSGRSGPVLPPASRPTFDLSSSGSGYIGATIRALETRWQKALVNHDMAAIDDLIADDFVGTSTTGRLGSKSTLLYEVKRDKNTYTSAAARGMIVRSQGPRMAIVTGVSKEAGTTADGQRFKNARRFTDTWVERGGRWQCVASHATELPK